ncbi:FAD-binding oxidoreductase [Novosphingobium sp. B 225]|uniref:FAD-binding oxidoreductase n=1 Tax=Novosphingobium sp. B 225 TaxID=1961849 RepID=UPI000B4A7B4E|nr:FAD-binding oxidoreductase [Novosphingobium sp. B 225]
MTDLLQQIAAIVGPKGLLTGEDVRIRAADWLGASTCQAKAVVRPASTEELSAVMKLCHAAGQSVVPAGGLTGLVHGTDCTPDDIQISLERMRSVQAIDPVGRTMTVEAGIPVQAAQEAAEAAGLRFAVDWGGRGTATIGGGISTNAGGNSVVRYGMMRDNVLGLEAVLADGTVISAMNSLIKNNAAYDLKHLFIGSEGTLGIVTRAVLKLQPAPQSTNTAMLALDGFGAVQDLFVMLGQRLGSTLTAFEVMWANFYEPLAVISGRHTPPLPAGHSHYVLLEMSGNDPDGDAVQFETVLGEVLEAGLAADAVIAASQGQADGLWKIRDDIEGLYHYMMPAANFDISLPITAMEEYVEGLRDTAFARLGETAKMVVFGHIGDGNLHIMIGGPPYSPDLRAWLDEVVFSPLKALGGSISAEHGIGLEKRDWLAMCRSDAEIALMRTLKAALDPTGILNPGKVLA